MDDEEPIIEEEVLENGVHIYGAYHSIQPLQFSRCCRSDNSRGRTFFYSLCQIFPIFSWVTQYRASFIHKDFLAGLTTGLTGLPEAIAMASVAGLPLQYGLYSTFIGSYTHVFFGVNHISYGLSTAVALLVHQSVTKFQRDDAASVAVLLTFWTGLIQLTMGIFQLGYLVDFVSLSVSKAFVSATVLVILVDQLKDIMGLRFDDQGFVLDFISLFRHISETNLWDLTMGLCCLLIIVVLYYLQPSAVPLHHKWYDLAAYHVLQTVSLGRYFVAVLVAALVETTLRSQHIHVLSVPPEVALGFPDIKVPDFQFGNYTSHQIVDGLGPSLAIIPLISILEVGAVIKHVAKGQRYNVNSREFRALGLANFLGSFFGSLPVSASLSQSELASQCEGKTHASGLIAGTVGLLATMYASRFLSFIPTSAVAAVVICTVCPTIDLGILEQMWRIRKGDLLPYIVTFLSCLLLGVEYGILIGILVSVALILFPVARPEVAIYQSNGEIIVTPYGIISFPAVRYIRKLVMDHIDRSPVAGRIVFDGSHWNDLDFTVAVSINDLIREVEKSGWTIRFTEVSDVVSGTFETPSQISWPTISEEVSPS